MVWLIATHELKIHGRNVHPGEEFECSEKDAKAIRDILRKAKDAPKIADLPRLKEEPKAEPPPTPTEEPKQEPRYRRRDMRSED